MPYFRYIGDPAHDGEGPDEMVAFGHRFRRGEAVEVTGRLAIFKLSANRHFETVDGRTLSKGRKPRDRNKK